MRPQWTRRMTVRGLAVVLAVSVVPALVVPGSASAAGPSVDLPQTPSVPVAKETTETRPSDAATDRALRGDQRPREDLDGAGAHKATSLSPSATWDVSGHTGDLTWSYPLRVPPAPGGLQPTLALSYRSSAVDGHTSTTNNQPSWIGDGWDLSPGYVERTYGGCAEDTEGGTTPPKTGDLCWRSDNATAAFDGGGGMLIRNDANGVWRTKNDDGARIDRLTGAGNGDDDGEYWRITTVDGTQFLFGSQPASSSTWTVPVFGDDVNEPCHRPGSFDTSHCVQAWRWNLDKVIDRNGNVIRYYYDAESNSYGLNLKDSAVSYIRGGTLRRIDYGLNDAVPGSATGRVEFAAADRCVPGSVCDLNLKPNWPDTPLDHRCEAATCKDRYSPSFWSTKRLAGVTTQVWRGSSFDDVDRWTLDQQYPDPGDGEKAALWLKSITHTGLVGGSLPLPAVTFEGTPMANRVYKVDGLAPLNRFRVTGVVSETGGVTSITYASECKHDGGPMPASPQDNTLRCFPVRWAKKDQEERTDYFHKYVVERVVQSDRLSTSTEQVTSYEYLDGAAWHWDMSEFAKDDKKTWNEFRGFGRVRVRVGAERDSAGPVTMTEQRFHRGMDGDRLPNNGTRSRSVSDTEGGTRPDHDWLQGFGFESATFDGAGGPVVAKTMTEPVWQGPTATRDVFKAYLVRPGAQRVFTALKSGGWRVTRTETSYDDKGYGLPTTVNDLGDLATAADDRCATTTYARNTDRWVLNLPSRVETVAVNCATTPRFPEHAISDSRSSYDGNAFGAPPTAGQLTRTEVADNHPPAGRIYVATGTARHDVHGRVVEATDALGNTTRTAYTPATGGPVTTTTVTSPPTAAVPGGMVTTTRLEPAWGVPTKVTDPNNRVTEAAYDGLGRVTEVWLPNRPKSAIPQPQPSLTFAYQIRNDAPTVVSSTKIGPNGVHTGSRTLFDGLLRPRQVQAPAVGGGRLLTDTRYDSHGRAFKSTQPYFNDAAVDDTLWVASDTEVPGLTRTEFDGAGRPIAQVYQAGAGATDKTWRTTTAYDGDRIHVTPPQGGTATTTISDARGQVTELRQYVAPSPTGGYDSTRYTYTPAGNLSEVTTAGGATWRFGYDLRGRKVRSEDPDSGVSTMTYDKANRLISTRDARGITIAYAYDALGRKTAIHRDSLTPQTKLAEWVYDTALNGKGQLASSTRFVDGHAYTTSVFSYTSLYKPSESSVSIPAVEGLLAGTYTSYAGYGADGSLSGETYPAAGGLDAEDVKYVLDDWGRPLTTKGFHKGLVDLVTGTNYTRYGEPERIQLGAGTKRAWLSQYYDTNTRRLTRSIVDAEVAAPMQSDSHYTYDPAGTITSIADTVLGQVADVQCFRHDHLRRLTDAWTPAIETWSEQDGCPTSPDKSGLRGPAPYWNSYRYDKDGNRLSETRHATTGDTVRDYDYPDPGQPQPHTLRTVTGGGGTETFGYDAAGNTTSRTKAGVGESLAWDAEGHLASVTKNAEDTSFIYTADGDRLLRKDPTGTTLYLGNQEVRLAASGGDPVATRYYTHGGKTIAVRTGNTLTWLAGDHQATTQLTINAATMQVTRRRQLPFGAPRGETPSAWPNERGFLDGTRDPSTGLTHLGAREYDSTTARFISVDSIMNPSNPQQLHGYAYANNNPVTFSDATGLYMVGGEDDHGNLYGISYMGGQQTVVGSAAAVKGYGTSRQSGSKCGGRGKCGHSSGSSSGSVVSTSSRRAVSPVSSISAAPATPTTHVSGEQAENYGEWRDISSREGGGCTTYMEGCGLIFLMALLNGTAEGLVADVRQCADGDLGACLSVAETASGPGAIKRGAGAIPGAIRAVEAASQAGAGTGPHLALGLSVVGDKSGVLKAFATENNALVWTDYPFNQYWRKIDPRDYPTMAISRMVDHVVEKKGKISFNMHGVTGADQILKGAGRYAEKVTSLEMRYICNSPAARAVTTFYNGAAPC